jgi:hypothetical protein
MGDAKRTHGGVARDPLADGLAPDAVFLGRKVERKVVGLLDTLKRCGGRIIGCVANVEGDIAESEGMGYSAGAALAVLPGAEKEEESHDGQIGDGALQFGGGGGWEVGDNVLEVDEYFERDWAYTGGWGVLFAVSPELTGQLEIGVSEVIVAWIFGPHAGEDLGHGAKVLLHGPLANWLAVCGKVASADLVGK